MAYLALKPSVAPLVLVTSTLAFFPGCSSQEEDPAGSTGLTTNSLTDGLSGDASSGGSSGGDTSGGETSGDSGGAGSGGGSDGSGPGSITGGSPGTTGSSTTGSSTTGSSTSGSPDDVPDIAYCQDVREGNAWFVEQELEVLNLVNEFRAQGATCGSETFGPAGPLTMHTALRCSARVHSKDMNDRNFFSHVNPDGEGPGARMEKAGFDGSGGENIAGGRDNAYATMEDWMDSPGHCSNIMRPEYTVIGVGAHPGLDGPYRGLWTQNFGR